MFDQLFEAWDGLTFQNDFGVIGLIVVAAFGTHNVANRPQGWFRDPPRWVGQQFHQPWDQPTSRQWIGRRRDRFGCVRGCHHSGNVRRWTVAQMTESPTSVPQHFGIAHVQQPSQDRQQHIHVDFIRRCVRRGRRRSISGGSRSSGTASTGGLVVAAGIGIGVTAAIVAVAAPSIVVVVVRRIGGLRRRRGRLLKDAIDQIAQSPTSNPLQTEIGRMFFQTTDQLIHHTGCQNDIACRHRFGSGVVVVVVGQGGIGFGIASATTAASGIDVIVDGGCCRRNGCRSGTGGRGTTRRRRRRWSSI